MLYLKRQQLESPDDLWAALANAIDPRAGHHPAVPDRAVLDQARRQRRGGRDRAQRRHRGDAAPLAGLQPPQRRRWYAGPARLGPHLPDTAADGHRERAGHDLLRAPEPADGGHRPAGLHGDRGAGRADRVQAAAAAAAIEPEYHTIGDFYRAVLALIESLSPGIFTEDHSRQVTGWVGRDRLHAVVDLDTATTAINLIIDQGEGTTTTPVSGPDELAHYYRFEQIQRGETLVVDPAAPDGFAWGRPPIPLDDSGVWPMTLNPPEVPLPEGSEVAFVSNQFDATFTTLVDDLQRTFTGEPELLGAAMAQMHALRLEAQRLMPLPVPGTEETAGPGSCTPVGWTAMPAAEEVLATSWHRRHAYLLLVTGMLCAFMALFVIVEQLHVPVLTDADAGFLDRRSWAVALTGVALLVADVVLPVPSAGVMIAQGAVFGLVAGSVLSLVGGTGATVAAYLVGRRSRGLVERLVSPEQQRRAEAFLDRHGVWAIVVSRPVPMLAETVGIIAGDQPDHAAQRSARRRHRQRRAGDRRTPPSVPTRPPSSTGCSSSWACCWCGGIVWIINGRR